MTTVSNSGSINKKT